MILLLWACAKTSPQAPEETLPVNPHAVAVLEADALVRDPARGGPPIHPGSAPLPPFQGVDRSTARYVGSEVCQGCHLQAFEVWASSSHAHSMATLRHDQQEHNPSCLSCHYTGFGHPGAPMKSTLAKVGCESCHGPASNHIQQPQRGYGSLPASGAACVACHTVDNSPDFVWQDYWMAIQH
jgi:hypothetical protein